MSLTEVVEQKKVFLHEFSSYIDTLRARSPEDKLQEFADFRKFKLETVKETGIFYIGDMAEMIHPEYFSKLESFGVISPTNKKPIFHNRYLIPIKDTHGNVLNVVGYSAEADERYVYGTAPYYRRTNTLWGLENLEMAYEMGFAFVTEGITDSIRLRDMGYKNSFAMCGTHSSDFIIQQLNRCRYGIIRVPDRDKAGLRALKGWEFNRHLTLYINLLYKDVDEMVRSEAENEEWLRSYIEGCIGWIKSKEHGGQKSECESATVL